MFSIAYRMVGSVGDAEDIVQEAFLRFHRASAEGEEIESPKAYVSAITTRLAIDHLRRRASAGSATSGPGSRTGPDRPRVRRRPPRRDRGLALDGIPRPAREPLATERAVFLLREVFEYGYDEIARVIGKSEDNCRQIAVRARARSRRSARVSRPRDAAGRARSSVLRRDRRGRHAGPLDLLQPTWSPTAMEAARPPRSRGRSTDATRSPACCSAPRPEGNASGCPARPTSRSTGSPALFFDGQGRLVAAVSLDIADDLIQTVRAIANRTSCST
jgi:RNA polymerase sigma-70 factor (ECF subfamily)